VVIAWCFLEMHRHPAALAAREATRAGRSSRGMRLVACSRDWTRFAMMRKKSAAKSSDRSYVQVIFVSLVIAVLVPFVRALATGDTDVAAAYAAVVPSPMSAGAPLHRSNGSDELSLLVVGGFLLGLGSVLRRVA
jgi:uncharacterized membrane protein YedE/YeeE